MLGTVQVTNPGAKTFLDQLDTPSSYVGEAGKVPMVSTGGTLEFALVSGGDPTKTYKDPVISRSLLEPPSTGNTDGDRYIVGTGVAGDWYSAGGTWDYRQKFYVPHAKVPSDQTNFPVAVIIKDASNKIFGHARSDGYDILFTSSDKLTKLDHEIVEYSDDVGTKYVECHVKVPTLSSTGNTDIYMYYGNAAANTDPSLAATWDAGYKFVQHLSDLTTSTTKDSVDVASNMTKGAANNPLEVDGIIGKAQSCDGVNDYLKTANNFLSGPSKITVSAWIKKEAGGHTYECALHKATGTTIGSSDYWLGVDIGDYLTVTIGANQGGIGWAAGKTTTKAVYGVWYHLAAVWDGSVVKVYLDGVFNKQYNLVSYGNNNTDTRIGASSDGANYMFKGLVDEVRVSNSERSADWITTEHNNQSDPDTFLIFDTEEAPSAGGAWAPYPKYITTYVAATTGWTFEGPPLEGWTCWIEDENARVDYNGSAWVSGDLLINHNQTAGLQGGTTGEFYHFTETAYTAASRLATNALSGLMPSGKLDSWDSAWHIGQIINEELQLEMEAPSFRLHDTSATGDGNQAIRGVYNTSTGTSYKGFALYKGTVTEGTFTPDPANPLLHITTGNRFDFYDHIGLRGNKEIRFYNSTHYVGFEASTGTTGTQVYKLPVADSTGTQALTSNGSGVLGWTTYLTTIAGGDHSGLSNLDYASAGHTGFLQDTADVIKNTHIDWGTTGANQVDADDIPVPVCTGGSAYGTVQDIFNTTQASGKISGGGFTDNSSGSITVSSGSAIIRASNSDVAEMMFCDWAEDTSVSLTDNKTNYIYAENSSGTIIIGSTITKSDVNNRSSILLGKVYRDGTDLHLVEAGMVISEATKRTLGYLTNVFGEVVRASGYVVGETGERYLTTTASVLYAGLTRLTTTGIDTSSTGTTFATYYYNGTAWIEGSASQIDNLQWNDTTTGLETLTSNRYGVHWIYGDPDGHIMSVYGQGDYTLALANAAVPPTSLPDIIADFAFLAAKIIVKKSATGFLAVLSAFDKQFTQSGSVDHNETSNLTVGDVHTQYTTVTGTRGFTTSTGDALGDIWYRGSTGNVVRLGVGTSGQSVVISTGGVPSYTTPAGGTDEKVALSTGGTADVLGTTSTGGVLRTDETITKTASTGSDYVTLAVDQTKLRVTHCVTYTDVLALDANGAFSGVLSGGSIGIVVQPDIPRVLSATLDAIGTPGQWKQADITITGKDQDGKAISKLFDDFRHDVGDPSTTGSTDHAFATISDITVANILGDAGMGTLSIGFTNSMGLPNYPFNSTGDVFKIKLGTLSPEGIAGWTINKTYGTALPDVAIQVGDDYTFWYRPYAT